ncbi:hypothetical protein GCM10007079_27970 [Nocardiopsis terrae]|nr:hypothetical protein GCM10007079_27970 [Nocardiopsis terrae]
MTARLWWVFASALAWALAQVIGAPTGSEPRIALAPAPRRLELSGRAQGAGSGSDWVHPDRVAGALVRPYMLRE